MQFSDDDPSKPKQHKDGAHSSIDGLDNEAERIARLPQSIAHLFLYGIRLAILERAIERAAKLKMPVYDVIISEGFVTEVTFYLSLARSLELPFCFTPRQVQVEKECREVLDSGIALFVAAGGELRFMVAPRGSGIPSFISEFAKHRNSRSEKFVFLTTPSNFLESVRRATNQQTIHYTTSYLEQTKPRFSAAGLPTVPFVLILLGTLLSIVSISFVKPALWCLALTAITIFPVIPSFALKLWIIKMAYRHRLPPPRPLSDDELPVYTVLVPLYDETSVIPQLIRAILAIDYPHSKLDVKIILEESDVSTIDAVRKAARHPIFDIVICPNGAPKTKPRALDMGLYFAKGDCVVVYDAEDIPDPGQLRLAAAYFADGGSKLGCLQARLEIENSEESWLSRMFALEYARLFNVTIPGMAATGLPIPLGGTSNHFRRDVLDRIGRWDPWNVTEDADLGLRLARFGYTVADLPSFTLEEAPLTLPAWFNQRVRWMKGWMQTSLVHCRYPGTLITEMGLIKGFLLFLVATNTLLSSLFHPFLLLIFSIMYNFLEPPGAPSMSVLLIMLVFSIYHVFIDLFLLYEGAKRRRIRIRLRDIPLYFLYSLLVTAASWSALKELAVAPSFWRKTSHGITEILRSGQSPTPQK